MDIAKEVTATLIERLESGDVAWRPKCWYRMDYPRSHASGGEAYNGINVIWLSTLALAKGWFSPWWLTEKEVKRIGGTIRAGEETNHVIFFTPVRISNPNDEETRYRPLMRVHKVFNANQIENLPAYCYNHPIMALADDTSDIAMFVRRLGARIVQTSTPQASYLPEQDLIHMPPMRAYEWDRDYYGDLAKQLLRWTGAKERLNRHKEVKSRPWRNQEAYEALVIELGSLMLSLKLQVPPNYDNSAALVAEWIKLLKTSDSVIFDASADAQKAVNYLAALGGLQ